MHAPAHAWPAPARKTAKRRAAPPQRPMPARASGGARHTATARSRKRPDRRDRWQKPLAAPNAPFLSGKRPCAKPRQAQKPPPARAKGARRAGSATGACHFSQSGRKAGDDGLGRWGCRASLNKTKSATPIKSANSPNAAQSQ